MSNDGDGYMGMERGVGGGEAEAEGNGERTWVSINQKVEQESIIPN